MGNQPAYTWVQYSKELYYDYDPSMNQNIEYRTDIPASSPRPCIFFGAHVGYEFLKHIPLSVGIEYGEFKYDDYYSGTTNSMERYSDLKTLRIPLKFGYFHAFGKIRMLANAGFFAAILNKNNADGMIYRDINGSEIPKPKIKSHLGYIGEIGIGYVITSHLIINLSFEYNRPFKEYAEFADSPNSQFRLYQFYGANIGITYRFGKEKRMIVM
jgi:opacity protein-like surface antigen